MPLKSLSFSTLVLVGLVAASFSIAQDTDKKINPFEDMLRQSSEEISDEDVREIISIRQRMGGGTKLDLGSFFTKESTASKPEGEELLGKLKNKEDYSIAGSNLAEQIFMRHVPPASSGIGIGIGSGVLISDDSAKPNALVLRNIAKRMEMLAADMEDLEIFEDADFLRSRANKIRLRARKNTSRQARASNSVR